MKVKQAMDKKGFTPQDMVEAKIVKSYSYALRVYKGKIPGDKVANKLEHWLFPLCDFDEIKRPWKY